MVYREFGNTGIKMSTLGFGAMRLPMMDLNGKRVIDEDKAIPMIHRAFELGVNYIDTAPGYCDGLSEITVGKAVNSWKNGRIYVSTKNPIEDNSGDHWRARLENSLKKINRDSIDFYHMWGINLATYQNSILAPNGPLEAALRAKEEGLIQHMSFSFHDAPDNMIPIIDSGYFESVLMQYNLLDRSNERNIDYAHSKGLGVVIMGPVGGGRLGALLGGKIKSTPELALRFVLANPHVSVALSGMSSIEMVEENAKVASIEGVLSEKEAAVIQEMFEENKKLAGLYCTGCRYCMPCEQGLNIPHLFTLMNYHRVYGLTDLAKAEYQKVIAGKEEHLGKDISYCIQCGQCESKCPQHLHIIEKLAETEQALRG